MSTDVHSHLEDLAPELVERLDDTCDRFEAEWKAGRRPRIKDHLSDAAETERATWLRELLALELDWRRRRGERPTPWEYLNEFPKDRATIHTVFADARTTAPRQVAPVEEIETDSRGQSRPEIPSRWDVTTRGEIGANDRDPHRSEKDASREPIAVPENPVDRLLRAGALTQPIRPGTLAHLGRFDILGVLGSGGMGIVLRACDPGSGEQVAIKLLKPDLVSDPMALFRREARHMAQLAHPNILRVSEVAGDSEWPFYVMPHLAGGPLSETIHHRPLDKAATLHIARQIATALAYAHSRGLIHRDLKPSNILLDDAKQAQAYLADFGLSRPLDNDTLLNLEQSQCVGTVAYMSPAVAKGEAEDTRCDIYSFGAVLREMLTGRPPYEGRSVLDVLRQIMATPPEPISIVNPHAHPGLMLIADGAMARDLRDRYSTMTDVIADLDRVAHGQEPLGPHGEASVSNPRRRRRLASVRRRGPAIVLLLAVLMPLVLPGLLYWRLAAGNLDPKFGKSGKVFTDLATYSADACRKVLIQPDGKILGVGRCEQSGRIAFAVVRYHIDGSPDLHFGKKGVILTDLGEDVDTMGVALQPDGKIVVAGPCSQAGAPHDFAVVRYNAEGTLDDRFGKKGVVLTDLGADDYAVGVALQPDGRIVVAGHSGQPRSSSQRDPPHDFALVRYNSDGSLDCRFGKNGVVLTDLRGADEAAAVAVQSDGKIVVGGHSGQPSSASQKNPPHDFALVRYNADGSLDDGSANDISPGDHFGRDGTVFTDFGGSDEIWSILLQPGGKILAGGFSWGDLSIDTLGIKLARYNADGNLDPSFGDGGKVSLDLPGNDQASDFALQPDGKILAAVNLYHRHNDIERRVPLTDEKTLVIRPPQRPSPNYDIAVARFNATGTLDAQFGEQGVVFTHLKPDYDESPGPSCVAVQPDGKIVAGATGLGSRGQDFVLMRYVGNHQRVPKWW